MKSPKATASSGSPAAAIASRQPWSRSTAGGHVLRTGDHADAPAAALDQHLGDLAGLRRRCRRRRTSPGRRRSTAGRRRRTAGRAAARCSGSPSSRWWDTTTAPSTWRLGEVAQGARLLGARLAPAAAPAGGRARPSTSLTPRRVPAKNGSLKTRSSGSGTTTATESVRRVTRLRAAAVGRVAQPPDRRVHGGLGVRADPVAPVDGPRGGGPGDAREPGDLVQGRGAAVAPVPALVHPGHASDPGSGGARERSRCPRCGRSSGRWPWGCGPGCRSRRARCRTAWRSRRPTRSCPGSDHPKKPRTSTPSAIAPCTARRCASMKATRSGSCTSPSVEHVDVGRAVLGDVDGRRGVVVAEPDEEPVQALGLHLPAHVGQRQPAPGEGRRARPTGTPRHRAGVRPRGGRSAPRSAGR